MTLIHVEGDNIEDYEIISENSFKRYTYFHEIDCQTPASSMTGRYCRIATYYLDFPLKKLGRAMYGTDNPEYFLDGIFEDFNPKVTDVDVAENTGYDPEKYGRMFKEKAEFADKMEREYGMRIY